MTKKISNFCRIVIAAGGLLLVASIIWAALQKPLGESFKEIIADPWGLVTLIDLYLGFILISFIIAATEKTFVRSAIWIVPIFFLGNFWTAIWLVLRIGKIYADKQQ